MSGWASGQASGGQGGEWASERASEWESEQAREWASKQAGQWASGPGKGGKRGEQGERQQFFFSVQHHPNFYDFESNLGVFSGPPGPLILDQDGPCGL